MDTGEFSISEAEIKALCDPGEYSDKNKYPYINYLPFSKPSPQYIAFSNTILDTFRPIWEANDPVADARAKIDISFQWQPPVYPGTTVTKLVIQSPDFADMLVDAYRVQYPRASMKNGLIIEVHGGGYCVASAGIHIQYAEILSKLSGCPVICLDYKLAPEFPLPYAVNELLALYEYVLTKYEVPASKVAMSGGSCGGGTILLALQELARRRKTANTVQKRVLPFPRCAVLNSPWTNLALDSSSYKAAEKCDLLMAMPLLYNMTQWSVGNLDSTLNIIGNNNVKDERYSPINGSFQGISTALYFTVGSTEMLLDDSLECARKAFEAGIDVRCDIAPYMMHIWPEIANVFPESDVANVRAADWIMKRLNNKHEQTNTIASKL